MKLTLKTTLTTVVIIFSGFSSFGQNIITSNGDTIANISNLGIITNDSNQIIGEITSSGEIKNAQGQQIGSIDGNDFKDNTNSLIATQNTISNEEIEVLNSSNNILIKVRFGHMVFNSDNSILFNASEPMSDKYLIAYYLFFIN
ncbi:MAG: 5-fold beta-flower protein [Flavobacteriales bacterium]